MILRPVKIEFDRDQIIQRNHRVHEGSCLFHLETEMADLYSDLGGLPESINIDNTSLHQLWWQPDQIDFEDLGAQLGMKVLSVSSICQPAGRVIPWHRDSFFRIRQKVPPDAVVVRANIHLQDAAIGHFVQYEFAGELITHTNWCANTGLLWDAEVPHLGANVGFEDKYTLQVSGILVT